MNSFDAVVYLGLTIAVVTGFNTGLLRSAIAILAYIAAMPIAMGRCHWCRRSSTASMRLPFAQNSPLFFGAFLVIGMVLGKLACMALDDIIGPQAGHRRPPWRRRPWRGARRPDCDHGCADLRPACAGKPPAGIHDRLAVAAGAVGRRANGRQVPSAGSRGCDRPPEERPAHIIGVVSLICISAVAAPLSGPLDLARVAASPFKNHLTQRERNSGSWDQRPPRHRLRIEQGPGARLRHGAGQ